MDHSNFNHGSLIILMIGLFLNESSKNQIFVHFFSSFCLSCFCKKTSYVHSNAFFFFCNAALYTIHTPDLFIYIYWSGHDVDGLLWLIDSMMVMCWSIAEEFSIIRIAMREPEAAENAISWKRKKKWRERERETKQAHRHYVHGMYRETII